MPLQRYQAGNCFESEGGTVNFGMIDAQSNLIIPCQVTVEAIAKLCGSEGERNGLTDFEECRQKIEAAASALYDRSGGNGMVFVTADELAA